MEPKPVITYFGDVEILGTVLQKKLQTRLSHLQVQPSSRDEGLPAFSSLCSGVEFLVFKGAQDRDLPFYRRPAVHTFWSGCSDADRYRTHDRPLIKQWLDNISTLGGGRDSHTGNHTPPMTLLIYCVTAEVRAKKQRPYLGVTSIEERLRTDYKGLVDDMVVFRLASSEESRLVESFQGLVSKLNAMALSKFQKDIDAVKVAVTRHRGLRSDPEHFYENLFLRKLNLAVGYEVTARTEEALSLYSEATTDLENALAMFADSSSPPQWLTKIRTAPCTTWDYPKLAWTQLSWQYLAGIQRGSSPLLHTRTFLLVRVAHLLFVLERAWSVSELVIKTLHCMAREIKMLKLTFTPGAFDCWAYMTCNEAIQAFMARISPEGLESATSSLLLVRAELWHYALQKLHDIGVLCGLMPSSNKLNHDTVLIKHISSGITPVPQDSIDPSMIGVDDEGQKLQRMLNDRQVFQTEFLMLGEMVIGAFKHAGRRRMAFRVGTLIAQFHRDLGLVVEAEELLSDICKFYSEDQWTELSTKAYSLLADCQMKLRLEDKHVNTMLLLASFPPYPAASHDPIQWMNQLTRIAQRSPYQKLLTWQPFLDLVKMETVGRQDCYSLEDRVEMDLVIRMNGPKEMKCVMVTVQTKLAGSLHSLSGSSSGNHTPHKSGSGSQTPHKALSGLSPASSTTNMEDLDLELHNKQLPHSRPIGESSKFRSSCQAVTHISHATIAEMEAGWHVEEGVKGRELVMAALRVDLKPGENRIRLQGKGTKAGEFAPHKLSIKFGSLDFVHTVPPKEAVEHIFTIQDPQINVDIALTPEEGVFLGGVPQECVLSFITTGNMTIPDHAHVRVVARKEVAIQLYDNTVETVVNAEDGTVERHFMLPAVPAETSCECHMSLTLPGVRMVHTELAETPADQTEQLPAWQHVIDVFCDWLTPCYVASLPLVVYEPLTLTCLEHSTGQDSFLQLLMRNTSPLPLLVKDPALTADVELEGLHGNLPQVFFPLEDFSFLWRVLPAPPILQPKAAGSFGINFSLLPLHFDWDDEELPSDPTFHSTQFQLQLSNMQTLLEVKASIKPQQGLIWVTNKQSASLEYKIRNIAEVPPQETQFGATPPHDDTTPTKQAMVEYEVCADKKEWSLLDKSRGDLEIPEPQEDCCLRLTIVPNTSGPLPVPLLLLKYPAGGSGCVLTPAQVHNVNHQQVVTVHPTAVQGEHN